MKRRNQWVKLEHLETGETKMVLVVLADSKMGYMGPGVETEYYQFYKAFHNERKKIYDDHLSTPWPWWHPSKWKEVKA